MSTLPEDLIREILLRSPVKFLARSKCVSKAWLTLISDRNFVKLHIKQSIGVVTDTCLNVIVSFNIGNEQFREIPLPAARESTRSSLVALKGYLSMVAHVRMHHEIWVMMKYGVKDSWIKLLKFNDPVLGRTLINTLRVITVLKNGEILVEMNSIQFFLYSHKYKTLRRFDIRGIGRSILRSKYVESLVSPKQIENRVVEEEERTEEARGI
ncbi:F-box domain [Macleaya cordata]|uniref:F-box domain n=1 Tax=Macleaya cordata TaxID=56857 RepID=A0A200QFP5_MACCD|nr:F-box domain [Macleaya cordata]